MHPQWFRAGFGQALLLIATLRVKNPQLTSCAGVIFCRLLAFFSLKRIAGLLSSR